MRPPVKATEFTTLCLIFLSLALVGVRALPQRTSQTLAERIGYPRGAKLLIVHADDLGMTHAVNAASIKGLESGLVTSASMMVPCPWFPEIADYAKNRPDVDLGLHLTLTSERVYLRWGPVAPRDKVPTLVDPNGYFFHDWAPATRVDPREVEVELRAQIDRALAMGVRPTHLDSHQYRLYENGNELFQMALKVAHDYKLPLFIARDWFTEHAYLESSLASHDIVIDHTVTIAPAVPIDKWNDFYRTAVNSLQPGVTEFVIHLAFADDEMRAATRERDTWGAAWRQRDFDFFTSAEFRELLQKNHITLIGWRQLTRAAEHE